ncbi:uncharacterized protein LOC118199125 isoform X1 [Stegodyphus dumicola]|uniref:uncharacterized protein LOC118199125 isoform X1 n=1 Tax=Stegodyphus dumicola TaxID=202533 RepID=UPI0015B18A22|nr:uncharacterized protein LOC118199125 isoform X1 [Stegodyphus dumicola]
MDEILTHILISCNQSISCAHLILNFLINVCVYKDFASQLIHKSDTCLLCTVANLLLQRISPSPLEYPALMVMIEDFVSTVFCIHNTTDVKLESSPCSSEVLRSFVTALWKFCEVMKENDTNFKHILKKGFHLLHIMSNVFQNFKEKRTSCEDYYILFISKVLTLSKEDPEFKEFHDLIHDLWDFQEDMSEFDSEDQVEDISDTTATVGLVE